MCPDVGVGVGDDRSTRWRRFYGVGAIGIGVQLAVLELLVRVAGLPVMTATPLAVETAIVHNFCWHEAVTWRDRPVRGLPARLARFLAFNLTAGAVSLGANTVLTTVLWQAGVSLLAANLVAIGAGSVLTFLLGDRVVFRVTGSDLTG